MRTAQRQFMPKNINYIIITLDGFDKIKTEKNVSQEFWETREQRKKLISQCTRQRESVCGECGNNKMLMLIVGKGSSRICYTGNKEGKTVGTWEHKKTRTPLGTLNISFSNAARKWRNTVMASRFYWLLILYDCLILPFHSGLKCILA